MNDAILKDERLLIQRRLQVRQGAGPACAGDPETKREKSVCVLPYQAHARHDQKCDYRKHQRASPMPRDSPQSQAWTAWTPFEASA